MIWDGIEWREEVGRPALWDHEHEMGLVERVAVKEESSEAESKLILTNQRLIWLDPPRRSLPLSLLQRAEFKAGGLLSGSDRIKLILRSKAMQIEPWIPLEIGLWDCGVCGQAGINNRLVKCPACGSLSHRRPNIITAEQTLTLSCRKGGKDLARLLQRHLNQPSQVSLSVTSQPSTSTSSMGLGVGSLQTTQARQVAEQGQKVDEAMGSLNALMTQAGEMSKLAHQLVTKLNRKEASLATVEEEQFRQMLWQLGLETDYSTTTGQNESIALRAVLDKLPRTIISLADLYCWYNRGVRGTALCSPADLKQAVLKLSGTWQLKRLPGGVAVVLRTDEWDDLAGIKKKLVSPMFTVGQFATEHGLSFSLAKSLLTDWELEYGLIARDSSPAGLIYHYPNKLL